MHMSNKLQPLITKLQFYGFETNCLFWTCIISKLIGNSCHKIDQPITVEVMFYAGDYILAITMQHFQVESCQIIHAFPKSDAYACKEYFIKFWAIEYGIKKVIDRLTRDHFENANILKAQPT